MNETPNPPNVPAHSETVADALATLRVQFQAALIILIMVCGALDLYLLKQYMNLRNDVAALEPTVGQMVAGYQQATVPLANKFLSQLTEFARTHPDFQPILQRYNIQGAPAPAAPAVAQPAKAATPAPAPAKTSTAAPAPAKTPSPAAPPKK